LALAAPSFFLWQNLRDVFQKFDSNGDGILTKKNFRHLLDSLMLIITDEEFEKFCLEMGIDSRSKITYGDFLNVFQLRETKEGHAWLTSTHRSACAFAKSSRVLCKQNLNYVQSRAGVLLRGGNAFTMASMVSCLHLVFVIMNCACVFQDCSKAWQNLRILLPKNTTESLAVFDPFKLSLHSFVHVYNFMVALSSSI
jgi:hypothetical protein